MRLTIKNLMGLWTFYFGAKLYLFLKGAIRFDIVLNGLFLFLLLVPLPRRLQSSVPATSGWAVVCMLLGLLLLWRDSWLPMPADAIRMLQHNGMPSRAYVLGFLMRFAHLQDAVVLTCILAVCIAARSYRKILAISSALFVLAPLFIPSQATSVLSGEELNKRLSSFYNAEAMKMLHYTASEAGAPAFDIIILQVCSLSWDDLRELGMEQHPLFKQFDVQFTKFNSVSTYSNPAAIRLLNANCGQRRHQDLYGNLPRECSLMNSLAERGYATAFARNHNGRYGQFDDEVKRYGHLDAAAFSLDGIIARKYMFDDSPVYDDFEVLKRWWAGRIRSGKTAIVLYYNTVSLHDGSHWISDEGWWKRDHKEQYRKFAANLLDDMVKFIEIVSASGRKVVLVFVGEHGRAVRGSAMETPGLRDVPLPRVTLTPFGIKLIGKGRTQSVENVVIEKPVSYLALAFMLSAFMERSPFDPSFSWTKRFSDSIPQTDFVSENEGNLILKSDGGYYLFGKEKKWIPVTDKELL